MSKVDRHEKNNTENPSQLRRGWTTGACATAATKSALARLLTGEFIDPVTITLPKGDTPAFALAHERHEEGFAEAGIVKDAGDDPDVTHGATIISRVSPGKRGQGVKFHAGEGVGQVTKAGLPIGVGEAAINPVPRRLMAAVVQEMCAPLNIRPDFDITIRVPGGEKIAERTWNPRLGIVGGISILGTTGVVHPFSCSAWIHSIHRGIDVARAANLTHVLGATGSTSENGACALYDFPEIALLDMGDFAGGLLKYLRKNPIPKLTLAGGFAKFTKLAQGALDLHSGRSQVDFDWLADQAEGLGADQKTTRAIRESNTALEALTTAQSAKLDLPSHVGCLARNTAKRTLMDADVEVEIIIFDRSGSLLARTPWR